MAPSPLRASPAADPLSRRASPENRGDPTLPRRILIVEDDEKSRRLLTDVLQFHGFDVCAVPTGEEGLADAKLCSPDAALLDIQLPGISGFDVLAALRSESTAGSLPVIAVTASVMDQDRKKILAAGFDAYVPKPVNIRELVTILNELLSKNEP